MRPTALRATVVLTIGGVVAGLFGQRTAKAQATTTTVVACWCMNHDQPAGTGDYLWETEIPGFDVTTNAQYFQRSADQMSIVILQSGIYEMSYNVRLGPVAAPASNAGESITLLRVAGVNHSSDHHFDLDPTKTSIHHATLVWPVSAGQKVTVNLSTGALRKGNLITQSVEDGNWYPATTTNLCIKRLP